MYREAAPAMKKIWLQMRSNIQDIMQRYNIEAGELNRIDMSNPDCWPLAKHEAFLAELDEAKKLIARYETLDPVLYEQLCQHIEAEAIGVMYNILDANFAYLTQAKKDEYLNRMRYDIEWMGLQQMTTVEQTSATLLAWLETFG